MPDNLAKLSSSKKSSATVVGKDDGESFWQPMQAGGFVTIKISPWNVVNTNHTVFLQELPPGGIVSEHFHEDNEEIFICLSGSGIITIDSKEHEFTPEVIAYIGKYTQHSIKAIGDSPLRFVVIISPTGLEERLKQMGKPRELGELPPQPFKSNAPSESHGVRRSTPASGYDIP